MRQGLFWRQAGLLIWFSLFIAGLGVGSLACQQEASIRGEVTYQGPYQGLIAVGLFKSYPPIEDADGPFYMVVVGEASAAQPTLPYEIRQVADGKWYVGAFLDVGSDDPMDPDLVEINDDSPIIINAERRELSGDVDIVLPPGSASIHGKIHYTGSDQGYVMAGLFKNYPPLDDDPGPYRTTLVGKSNFVDGVMDYSIDFVSDGAWYVAAFMDIGSDALLDPELVAFADDTPVVINAELGQDNIVADVELPSGQGKIYGDIRYTGPHTGLLMAALFKKYPPIDDDDGPFHTTLLEGADFSQGPVPYEIKYVEDGEWFVAGILDVGADDAVNAEMVAFADDEPLRLAYSEGVVECRADIDLPEGTGTFYGEITYEGPYQGLLMAALFKKYPPIDDDDGPFHTTLLEDADFSQGPVAYEIPFVEDGPWYVAAILDIGADDPLDPEMVAFASDQALLMPQSSGQDMVRADVTLPAGTGVVRGVVNYQGPYSGLLMTALFKNYPPLTDDDGPFLTTLLKDADFAQGPVAYEIPFVDDGTWYAAAILDIGADDPLDPEMVAFSDANPLIIDQAQQQGEAEADITLPSGTGTIYGSIDYHGPYSGLVLAALFKNYPPLTDEDGPFLTTIVGDSDFAAGPMQFEIPFVKNGDWYVAGILDIGGDDPLNAEMVAFSDDDPVTVSDFFSLVHADVTLPSGVGTVRGRIDYSGEDQGVVVVSLFTQFPPTDPVQGPLFATLVGVHNFAQGPVTYAVPFVEPGTYVVAASLDISGDAPMQPEVMGTAAATISFGEQTLEQQADVSLYTPCEAYCGYVVQVCGGLGAPQFPGNSGDEMLMACMGFCLQAPGLPAETFGSMQGNSSNCRLSYANAAQMMSDPLACVAAGPTGGGQCGSWCDNYCDAAMSICGVDNMAAGIALYDNRADCTATCLQWPNDAMPGSTSGDTVQCRLNYVLAAGGELLQGLSVDSYCAFAAADSAACQ